MNLLKKVFILTIIAAFLYDCSSVPVTGRRQLSLVSDEEVLTLSLQQYNEFIKTAPISTDKTNTALVVKVGKNIAAAVELYLKASGMESLLSEYSWEFNLVKDSQVNAFCMPGGKIVVYDGILPYTQTETGLAVVLGHEVAHAVAKHANERMSQEMVAQYGASALSGLLSKSSSAVQSLGNTVFGVGAQYGVLLPFNRKQELEADHLGLIFMGIAGYNPNEALPFWQRMSTQGTATPEFMSTHPSDETRIAEIQKYLPEALQYYNQVTKPSSGSTLQPKTDTKWSF
ncbi:MAG: M48 family metallopeptidase [Dysgonamonadaceae bacterium]|nr:M48 family metallopeptidase [Dysgonamonadaceae bacterium]